MSEQSSGPIGVLIVGLLLSTGVFASLWWSERQDAEQEPPSLVQQQPMSSARPEGLCPLEVSVLREGEAFVWDSFRRCFERP